MNIDRIEDALVARVKLTQEDRDSLIDNIFKTQLKDDDPKYDDWNLDWLNSLSDEELYDRYRGVV